MKIAVLLKQVPDSQAVRLDPETGTLRRSETDAVTNPLDLCALAAAVRLIKDVPDSSLTAICMGPSTGEQTLRQALALGAGRAILICDRACAGSDSYVTALILAAAIERSGPFDLVLTGLRASDGETGQVGPEIAAKLGWPVITGAESLTRIRDNLFEVTRSAESEKETLTFRAPALVSVAKGIGQADLPRLERKIWARREPVTLLTANDLGFSPDEAGLKASPTRVVRVLHPQLTRRGRMIRITDSAALEQAREAFTDLLGRKEEE